MLSLRIFKNCATHSEKSCKTEILKMFPLEEVQSPEKGVWKKTALLPLVVKIGLCRQEVWLEAV